MVLIKHNILKSDIFFNPIFISGFSGSGFKVQVSQVAFINYYKPFLKSFYKAFIKLFLKLL